MPRALISGASGFIGSALGRHLAHTGHEVVGLSRRLDGSGPHCSYLRLEDPEDPAAVAARVARIAPRVIFHLAGSAAAGADELWRCNVVFTRNLLAAAARMPQPPTLVLVGSAAEYGELPPDSLPAHEDMPCHPVSAYGRAKLEQTCLGEAAAAAGLPVVVARLFNVIGPGLPTHLALGRFARCLAEMDEGGGILRTGDLSAERDFVALDDAVRILAALSGIERAAGKIVNICTGTAIGMDQLTRSLIRISGRRAVLKVDAVQRGISAVSHMVGSPARLRALGLSAATPDFESQLLEVWSAALGATQLVPRRLEAPAQPPSRRCAPEECARANELV